MSGKAEQVDPNAETKGTALQKEIYFLECVHKIQEYRAELNKFKDELMETRQKLTNV